MKSCREIKEMISAYIDKELDLDEVKAFEEHINSCGSCKQEYEDMLYIVGLCTESEEVELPENFKSELHTRLVQSGQSSSGANKSFWNKKYISVLTSVAAVLLLAVLFRGTLLNGYLPQKTDANPESLQKFGGQDSSAKAAVSSDNIDMKFSEAQDSGNAAKAQGSGTAAQMQKNSQEAARSDSSVQDRSVAQVTSVAVITNKNTNITIISENPQEQAEKIKQLATENGGEVWLPDVKTAFSMATASVTTKEEVRVNIKVPNTQYDSFKASLIQLYGASNVTSGQVELKDETKILEEMNNALTDMDNRIKEQESKDASSEELNNLKKDKESLAAQIEQTRFDSDFVFITVTVN